MDLSSRWLDLDRLAGAAEGAAPVASVAKLAAWVRDLLPGEGLTRGEHRHRAGQSRRRGDRAAAAGAGAVGRQAGDRASCAPTCRAAAAASSRATSRDRQDALAFNGSLGLRGTSTARFVAWATGNGLSIAADADGPFDLRANLTRRCRPRRWRPRRQSGRDVLKGSGHYKWSEPAGAGRGAGRAQARRARAGAGRHQPARPVRPPRAGPQQAKAGTRRRGGKAASRAQADLDLRVKAGQLVTAARTYRDFSAAVEHEGRPSQAAPAATGRRRWLQPRAGRPGGQPRRGPERHRARLGRCRHAGQHRPAGGAAGRAAGSVRATAAQQAMRRCGSPDRRLRQPHRRHPPTWWSTARPTARPSRSTRASTAARAAGAAAAPT